MRIYRRKTPVLLDCQYTSCHEKPKCYLTVNTHHEADHEKNTVLRVLLYIDGCTYLIEMIKGEKHACTGGVSEILKADEAQLKSS